MPLRAESYSDGRLGLRDESPRRLSPRLPAATFPQAPRRWMTCACCRSPVQSDRSSPLLEDGAWSPARQASPGGDHRQQGLPLNCSHTRWIPGSHPAFQASSRKSWYPTANREWSKNPLMATSDLGSQVRRDDYPFLAQNEFMYGGRPGAPACESRNSGYRRWQPVRDDPLRHRKGVQLAWKTWRCSRNARCAPYSWQCQANDPRHRTPSQVMRGAGRAASCCAQS